MFFLFDLLWLLQPFASMESSERKAPPAFCQILRDLLLLAASLQGFCCEKLLHVLRATQAQQERSTSVRAHIVQVHLSLS